MTMTPSGAPIPEATIARLPSYLRALTALRESGISRVSSIELAEAAHVQPALLRRDLSLFGTYGTRGVGYEVNLLIDEIGSHIGSQVDWPVVITGIGNLGRALAMHASQNVDGFNIVGLVDADPDTIGTTVAGHVVAADHDLEEVLERTGAKIVIITAPPDAAQLIVNRVVKAGVTSILNFAPVPLDAPDDVNIRVVDLSRELQILAFHESHRPDSFEESSL